MSIDSSWGDYLSTDTSVTDVGATTFDTYATPVAEPIVPDPVVPDSFAPDPGVVEPVLPEPVVDAVESELTGAVADQDWSDWHAASGDQWADSAQDWVDYANENLAAGNYEIANSGFERAASHADIANDNYDVSLDYSAQANTHLDTAAAEVAPYDTYSTYDAGTYDAGSSFDIAE